MKKKKKKQKRKIIYIAAVSWLQKFLPKNLQSVNVKPQIWNLGALVSWDKHFNLNKLDTELPRRCKTRRQKMYDICLGLSC